MNCSLIIFLSAALFVFEGFVYLQCCLQSCMYFTLSLRCAHPHGSAQIPLPFSRQ